MKTNITFVPDGLRMENAARIGNSWNKSAGEAALIVVGYFQRTFFSEKSNMRNVQFIFARFKRRPYMCRI